MHYFVVHPAPAYCRGSSSARSAPFGTATVDRKAPCRCRTPECVRLERIWNFSISFTLFKNPNRMQGTQKLSNELGMYEVGVTQYDNRNKNREQTHLPDPGKYLLTALRDSGGYACPFVSRLFSKVSRSSRFNCRWARCVSRCQKVVVGEGVVGWLVGWGGDVGDDGRTTNKTKYGNKRKQTNRKPRTASRMCWSTPSVQRSVQPVPKLICK